MDSILNQTFTDFELILVDDGSPDNCGAICDEYAEKDNRIVVIHQENGGLSAARNAGIDWSFANSDSRWLTFIDSDDWVHPQYLEILYKTIRDNDLKVSCCKFISVDQDLQSQYVNVPTVQKIDTKEFYLNNNNYFVISCAKLFDKTLFIDVRYPVGRINEDQFTTYKVLFKNEALGFVKEELYYYFQSPNSIMRSKFSIKKYDDIYAIEEQIFFFHKAGWSNLEESAKNRRLSFIYINALAARKANVYNQVPDEYKVSFFKALSNLYNILGRDSYEHIVSRYYPTIVKIQALYFKFKSLFKN